MSTAKSAERLDTYVVRQQPALSRASAAKLIEQGSVSVNGSPQRKAGYRVRPDDRVDIDASMPAIPRIELPILYEDDDCVVINKPVGLLTHSKGAFNPEPTVATWLQPRIRSLDGERAGIVHRLDRATSGVMICAKTPAALQWLQKQFARRNVKKVYVAVVHGVPAQAEAIIDMPIERNPKRPQTFRTGAQGKAAVTAYTVLKSAHGRSLLELRPTTGRTHQLRVHLKQLGLPIVGDTLYAGPAADRLYLHARSLELTLPDRTRRSFEAPVPDQFQEALRA